MKKMIMTAVALALMLTANANEKTCKKDEIIETKSHLSLASGKNKNTHNMTKGGFFFNVGTFIPSKNYLYPVALGKNDTGERYGAGFDFDLGNMFRFLDSEPTTFGLRVTWFSAGYTRWKINDTSLIRAVNISFARVGPYLTHKIDDDKAADIYYQIGPGAIGLVDENWNHTGINEHFGFTHELGAVFRYSKLSVGSGLRFGRVMDPNGFGKPVNEDDPKSNKDLFKMPVTNFRIFAGIKL